jgi:hypothetical protein
VNGTRSTSTRTTGAAVSAASCLAEVTHELAAFGDAPLLWVAHDGGRRHDEVLWARVDEMRYRITLRP